MIQIIFKCDTCGLQNSQPLRDLTLGVRGLVNAGWVFATENLYKPEEIQKTTCPECEAKRKAELCNSKDIRDRIDGGYYDDKSMQFKDDALEHVGLTNHPKAEKAFETAWEHGHQTLTAKGCGGVISWGERYSERGHGYSPVLCRLEELSVLLK